MRRANPLFITLLLGLPLALIGCDSPVSQPSPTEAPSEPPELAGPALFIDQSSALGLDFVHSNGASGEFYFVEIMGSTGAVFDVDGDSDLDIVLIQGDTLPTGETNASGRPQPDPSGHGLYLNQLVPSGSLAFVAAADSGLGRSYGMGAAVGDIDGDGDLDLFVTNWGANHLYVNDGNGHFLEQAARRGVDGSGLSVPATFLDSDNDGDLDLWVGDYADVREDNHRECTGIIGQRDYCGPSVYTPSQDHFFINDGDGHFHDATDEAGFQGSPGRALAVIAADFNADGGLDLYVANDGTPNHLWLNDGLGHFEESAMLAGCAVNLDGRSEASMGIGYGDVDADGDLDLLLAHLFGETNTLYLADGRGGFSDRTNSAGLGATSRESTAFGTVLDDFDLDGDPDIFMANGAVQAIEALVRTGDPFPFHQPNQLYLNNGSARFDEVTLLDALAPSEVSRAAIPADLDNDGDLDLVLSANSGPARILINQSNPADSEWLGLQLLQPEDQIAVGGTVVAIAADDSRLARHFGRDGSYASARDPRVLLPVGQRGLAAVEVQWPDGTIERFTDTTSGKYQVLRKGEGS